jgi:hypothetical protein
MSDLYKRFIFRAYASALAGHIRRPNNIFFRVQGACSLPVVGGLAESGTDWDAFLKTKDYESLGKHQNFFKFTTLASLTRGDFTDRSAAVAMTHGKIQEGEIPTKTTATAEVAGLEVGGRLKIELLRGGLTAGETKEREQPPIKPSGCKVKGVTIDGYQLDVRLDEGPFSDRPTMAGIASAYETEEDYFASYGPQFLCTGLPSRARTRKIPQARGLSLVTLVKSIKWKGKPHPDAKIEGHMVHVPELGRFFFGEMFLSDASRRLTMLRMKLGSDTGGDGAGAEVETNGTTWPA